ncbi:MAG: GIY-YIG nuclease family protein [Desulfobacteraceae bacterium]|nr:GIY-YIG nuclease family protein [Desulfobacteraceae bacterium]MBC2754057.1 GIY-YIG nuclease family protein [Desulfobacteraceae bacterium]
MSFYVYILKCRDGSYYTGHTDNLELRMAQHIKMAFPKCYTATRLPVELVFTQQFPTRQEALASERQIKGWSRKKKEAMMRGDWNEVSRLAQNALRQAQDNRTLRQAQGDRNTAVRGELVEPQAQDNRSVHALRPFDHSASSWLMAQGDRNTAVQRESNRNTAVHGEPALRPFGKLMAQDNRPVHGEPAEPRAQGNRNESLKKAVRGELVEPHDPKYKGNK